ncbi:2-C-methyl-D-erythritol 4-phosphate cytidylyltransferase [Candidatus Nitrospira allomarina]|uniref:2-C-methyl-D-erythritol 4-phosphate cytidylyltransferase n=1 Tax=Candidatus Nitrospira allomarina TaxID=3020900 RepID=A0AA96JVG5_9BACT|nr:2-C-methyl-D-erythritol 4-phosphate cytidylyltransferase [Candidatus Nitrospira allomarina]WNM56896.1 2-C-methyl-D-erythritol 4-phosphate cytidylyltransferase [Candidatus Nitrospira allomarina]
MFNSVVAVIPAAGLGTRMGGNTPKQYLTLGNLPLLVYSLQVFQQLEEICEVVLSVPASDREYCWREIVKPFGLEKVAKVVAGGARRQDSVRNGLAAISDRPDGVLVHDGVRPFIDQRMVRNVIDCAGKSGAAVVAMPIHDTVKRVDASGVIQETLKREELWQIQTPQVFRYDWLVEAHQQAQQHQWDVTDDAALIERMGYPVSVVEGSCFNIKVTKPDDLVFGEAILGTIGSRR